MLKIPVVVWIANAAARFTGSHGDITQQARVAAVAHRVDDRLLPLGADTPARLQPGAAVGWRGGRHVVLGRGTA